MKQNVYLDVVSVAESRPIYTRTGNDRDMTYSSVECTQTVLGKRIKKSSGKEIIP